MKARVLTSIPERVLTYAIDEAIQPRLSAALKKLHIEEYQVSPEELGEPVCLLYTSYWPVIPSTARSFT